MKKKTSMKDIAQQLGVSIALVSYVLNNQLTGRINKDTAEKIKHLAEELDYRPNHIAKSLKSSRTNTIGLILADISNPFSAHLARIIEDEAKKNKYSVIFGSADESPAKSQDLINLLLSRQVDGFIIAPAEDSENQLHFLQKQGMPFVLIDRYFPGLKVNHVVINNFKASYDAVNHLIGNGFKKIAMINFKTTLFHLLERARGYTEALRDAQLESETYLREVNEKDIINEVKQQIDELLTRPEPIDALFFGSNNLAIEGMVYIRSLKIRIPQDLAIVCFDEANAYNLFYCPLTYVRQPLQEIGKKAVDLLLESMEKLETCDGVMLDAELVVRNSSMSIKEIDNPAIYTT
jgi:LacI family transcriptional regulator